jgi:hypothetical protein
MRDSRKITIKNLNDLYLHVLTLVEVEDLKKGANKFATAEDFVASSHHGFGRFLRNEIGLWDETSPAYRFFSETYGLTHADDMSSILLRKVWTAITQYSADESWVAADVQRFKDHWKMMAEGNLDRVYTINGQTIRVTGGQLVDKS